MSAIGVVTEKANPGTRITVMPTSAVLAQFMPIKTGRRLLGGHASDECWLGLEGKEMFTEEGWGPQSLRTLWIGNISPQGWGTRERSDIQTLNDAPGNRLARMPRGTLDDYFYDALFAYCASHPDYVEMSMDDFTVVPTGDWEEGAAALAANAADISILSAGSPATWELAESMQGVRWIPLPNETDEDKEAWKAFRAINPVFGPHTFTDLAVHASPETPQQLFAYRRHTVTYDLMDENDAYWATMTFHTLYPQYKDMHSYLATWTLDLALLAPEDNWFMPWHEGSIRYFKDIGAWTPQMDYYQEVLLQRYPQRETR
jgi:TRAP-type uncharacterized transport system substrate-binding protein